MDLFKLIGRYVEQPAIFLEPGVEPKLWLVARAGYNRPLAEPEVAEVLCEEPGSVSARTLREFVEVR